jgi:hypothetical protein
MSYQSLREEIFALMLKIEESDNPDEIVGLQWEIGEKLKVILATTGLTDDAAEAILWRQYAEWLRKRNTDPIE